MIDEPDPQSASGPEQDEPNTKLIGQKHSGQPMAVAILVAVAVAVGLVAAEVFEHSPGDASVRLALAIGLGVLLSI